jgi:hypothetical protein
MNATLTNDIFVSDYVKDAVAAASRLYASYLLEGTKMDDILKSLDNLPFYVQLALVFYMRKCDKNTASEWNNNKHYISWLVKNMKYLSRANPENVKLIDSVSAAIDLL